MTQMTTKSSTVERRNFLNKLTSVIGGSAVLAVAAPLVQAAPAPAPAKMPEVKPKAKGYQRTEHIDTYYQLADL